MSNFHTQRGEGGKYLDTTYLVLGGRGRGVNPAYIKIIGGGFIPHPTHPSCAIVKGGGKL